MRKEFIIYWISTLKQDRKEINFYNNFCIYQCFTLTCISTIYGYYFWAMPTLILFGYFLMRFFKLKRYFNDRLNVLNSYLKENTSTTSNEFH